MVKICHLTSAHPPYDIRIFHKECQTLRQLDPELTLIAQNPTDEVIASIQIRAFPPLKKRWQRLTNLKNIYELALQTQAQIYHFHDPDLVLVGLMLKHQGKVVIYDIHEDVPRQTLAKEYIPQLLRPRLANCLEITENFAAKRFDALITATPHIRDRFQKIGGRSIDINNYPILSELYPSKINWLKKKPIVCYIGGISQLRGITEMVEAIGQTNGQLLLAGRFETVQQRQQTMGMSGWSRVQELGYLPREEVAQTLAKSMAGLVVLRPAINYLDALPVKMFEYMAAGIPVIASNFPLWQNIIEGNHCGLCVDPLNPQAIAQAIQWIFDHPREAEQMGQNGRKAVEEKYNWETEAKKLLALYQELLT
ncbi:MAG: glycosyltransferase family 4 protein [Symploca sp. SIO2E6]|nr:glycosyltransferase family 4 protein [Symploca sp. SIO2E6]